jgi:hypothetical protein
LCRISKVGPNVNLVARLPAGNVASGRTAPPSSHSFAQKAARQSLKEWPISGKAWEAAEEHICSPQEIRAAYLKSFGRYVAQLDTRRPLAGVILDHRNQRAMLRASR